MGGADQSRSTGHEDKGMESAVLNTLIDLHPARLTEAELVRELTGGKPDFRERDAIARAVRDLAAAGLLHRSGRGCTAEADSDDFVEPTVSALRFSGVVDR